MSTAQDVSAAVDTVRQLIQAGLLDPAALGQVKPQAAVVPGEPITVRDLAKKAYAGVVPDTARTYRTYIEMLVDGRPLKDANGEPVPVNEKLYPGLGDELAHTVLKSHLEEALVWVERRALLHAHWRAEHRRQVGRVQRHTNAAGARATAVAAWRKLFKAGVDDLHLHERHDSSRKVRKPKPAPSQRRPLPSALMGEFWDVITGSGDDPILDTYICQTIMIAAARREGLMNLMLAGIDREACTLRLDEKLGKVVDQPVPDWFAAELYRFAVSRGAKEPTDMVFRKRGKAGSVPRPITSRRLDYLPQGASSSGIARTVVGPSLKPVEIPGLFAPRRGRRTRRRPVDVLVVRAWARENGLPIATKGKIPRHIADQYWAAMDEG